MPMPVRRAGAAESASQKSPEDRGSRRLARKDARGGRGVLSWSGAGASYIFPEGLGKKYPKTVNKLRVRAGIPIYANACQTGRRAESASQKSPEDRGSRRFLRSRF